MLHFFKRWLNCSPSKFTSATRTSAVLLHTFGNMSLPLMTAGGALPLSPEVAASKRLLRCLGILILVPVLHLARCFGSKRAVLTYCCPSTIWASGASCAVTHTCLPDMRASCWTAGARPYHPSATAWLHLDAAQRSIVVGMPLLLQLGAELTDVWQAWLQASALLLR